MLTLTKWEFAAMVDEKTADDRKKAACNPQKLDWAGFPKTLNKGLRSH